VDREGGGNLFFVGDSFTPSGTDDYCLQNRNFVHADEGYRYCLDLLARLGGSYWLINQHVLPMFKYDAAQAERMRKELAIRESLLAELTPLPDANYAVDESWARFYPYAGKGAQVDLELQLHNHTTKPTEFQVRWNPPPGWRVVSGDKSVRVPARSSAGAKVRLAAAADAGFGVLTADVAFNGFDLRRWTEALLEVDDNTTQR
jgi:hypothetical protein